MQKVQSEKDCKVVSGESVAMHHHMVGCRMAFEIKTRKRMKQ